VPARGSAPSSKTAVEPVLPSVDDRVVRALGHPLRQRILGVLDKKVASPNDIAEELGENLGDVSYHMRVLRDNGAVELVRKEQRRGAIKHFYRSTMRPMLTDEQFARLPRSTRRQLFGGTLDEISKHVSAAAKGDGFDDPRTHVSWTPFELDDEAVAEMSTLLEQTLAKASEIAAASLARGGDEVRRTELVVMHFGRA
jgi:DNA-binding transcriptional ArsR family regulator